MSENDRNQNEGGGLFSDDYEAPKRENPYLKKNREKAKAEKAPKPPKAKPAKDTPPVSATEALSAETASALGEEETSRHRTFSDWMFEHVKLIAAIATVIVILALVFITDVVGVVEDLVTQSQQAEKDDLSLNYVKGLSQKSAPITWTDLEKFRRDETRAEGSVTWMIPVKGTGYEVWISGTGTSNPPLYVYLFDMKTGDRLVLGDEDFDAFIEAHS